MLSAFTELRYCTVQATDGPAGWIEDVQFDDVRWIVRHLVVGVPGRLPEERVLVPPTAVQSVDTGARRCALALSRSEIEGEPGARTAPPVSRQRHITLYDSQGLPHMSAGPDPHLRSARALIGYVVLGLDEEAGQVRDLLVEQGTWAMRYLLIQPTGTSRQTLIGPEWVSRMNWEERAVHLDVYRGHIDRAPSYDPSIPITRDYEQRLYAHYRRPGYWHDDAMRSR